MTIVRYCDLMPCGTPDVNGWSCCGSIEHCGRKRPITKDEIRIYESRLNLVGSIDYNEIRILDK